MLAAEPNKRQLMAEIRSNNIERIWHGERPTSIRTLILPVTEYAAAASDNHDRPLSRNRRMNRLGLDVARYELKRLGKEKI